MKPVVPPTSPFRPILHTASPTCSWPLRLPNSDGWKGPDGPRPGCSNCIQRFATAANSRASTVLRRLRHLLATRSVPPGCQSRQVEFPPFWSTVTCDAARESVGHGHLWAVHVVPSAPALLLLDHSERTRSALMGSAAKC